MGNITSRADHESDRWREFEDEEAIRAGIIRQQQNLREARIFPPIAAQIPAHMVEEKPPVHAVKKDVEQKIKDLIATVERLKKEFKDLKGDVTDLPNGFVDIITFDLFMDPAELGGLILNRSSWIDWFEKNAQNQVKHPLTREALGTKNEAYDKLQKVNPIHYFTLLVNTLNFAIEQLRKIRKQEAKIEQKHQMESASAPATASFFQPAATNQQSKPSINHCVDQTKTP